MSIDELKIREKELAEKMNRLGDVLSETKKAYEQADEEWSRAWGEWAWTARLLREAEDKEGE